MLISLLIREFPFNDRFDGVFKNTYNNKDVSVEASGSSRCYFYSLDRDVLTKPESVIDPEDQLEWCSNLNKSKNDHPWLTVVFNDRKLTASGYSLKAGCCENVNGCCCIPYSWSILGSNDNKTWTKLHSVEKNKELKYCKEGSFRIDKKGSFSMFKLIQDEPEPDCWYCIALSKLEFYGTFSGGKFDEITSEDEVSIIGRLKKT